VDDLIRNASDNSAKIIFICNPHNPTGYVWSEGDIRRVLDETTGLLVIDEAYIEFAGRDGMSGSAVHNERLIVLRTMSKAFGCASLRVGFAIGVPENIRAMNCAVDMYSIGSFSQGLARKMLAKSELVRERVGEICAERDRLYRLLVGRGSLEVFESGANFIYLRTPKANEVYLAAKQRGVLIRNYESAPEALRVSVGAPVENDAFVEALDNAGL
jgi:histidinol-phosphate aminotransferase